MGVEGGGKLIYKDVLPFAGMVIVECMLVGGNTLYKYASVEAINSYVFTFYVFLIGFICLLPCIFILHRRTSIPPIKISVAGKIFALSVIIFHTHTTQQRVVPKAIPTLTINQMLGLGFWLLLLLGLQ